MDEKPRTRVNRYRKYQESAELFRAQVLDDEQKEKLSAIPTLKEAGHQAAEAAQRAEAVRPEAPAVDDLAEPEAPEADQTAEESPAPEAAAIAGLDEPDSEKPAAEPAGTATIMLGQLKETAQQQEQIPEVLAAEPRAGEDDTVNSVIQEVLADNRDTDLHLSDLEVIRKAAESPAAEPGEAPEGPGGKKGKKPKKAKPARDPKNLPPWGQRHRALYHTSITLVTILNVLAIACYFIAYGPFTGLRDLFITTSMRTMTHKYLANVLYSTETIQQVLADNVLIEPDQVMDASAITIGKIEQPTTYSTIYEQQVLERDKDALYKVITLDEGGYKGWVVFVYDPKKISLAVSRYLGSEGEYVTTMAQQNNAVVAINGGGFLDAGGQGTGGYPTGYVIQNGKLVWKRKRSSGWGGGTIGFNQDGIMILTKSTGQNAINEGVYNGVDFGPFLIVNGQSAEVSGNGGWGIQPRTCIGQRQDGIVVFLVVDGRTTSSLGIDLNTAIDIMSRYSVYNAANLDGGASSVLAIDGQLINHPVGWDYTGERGVPNAWIVTP